MADNRRKDASALFLKELSIRCSSRHGMTDTSSNPKRNEHRTAVSNLSAPSISIVICNYNYGQYVSDAIRSAVSQTIPAKEIIVVDDGSTDNSRQEIEKFSEIVRVFKENGGQTSGIRAALDFVSSDVIVILDSDDVLLDKACEEITRKWRPGLTMLQFRLEQRNSNGVVIGYYPDKPFVHGGERKYVLSHGFIPSSPTFGNAFATSHVINAFQYNRERDRMYTDGYLIFTAPLYGDVLSLEEVLGIYRVHGANVSTSDRKSIRWLKNYIRTNYSHREGLAFHAKLLGLSDRPAEAYMTAYDWRAALQLKRLSPQEPEVARYSLIRIAAYAFSGFIRYPRISLFRRLKNIVAVGVLVFAPLAIVRCSL